MDELVDRGLFCVVWVGLMWITDALLSNTGQTTYSALMLGAVVITSVGLVKQAFFNKRKA